MRYLISCIFIFLVCCTIQAQDSRSAYRAKLEAMQKMKAVQIKTFLNPSLSNEERSTAFEKVHFIDDAEQVKKAATILKNNEEIVTIRIKAMMSILHHISNDNALLNYLFELIRIDAHPIELRRQALDALNSLTFSSPRLALRRSEFYSILRESIKDKDQQIRDISFRILCSSGDDFAQRQLIEGLNNPEKALLTPASSIRYLGYDIHSGHLKSIHKVLLNPPDEASKVEAIRQLGSHEESRKIMVNLLANQKEDIGIRKICAQTLSINDATSFEKTISDIIVNEDEDESLRAYGLRALTIHTLKNKPDKSSQFNKRLQQLKKLSNSPTIRSLANDFLEKTDNN